MKDFMKMKEFFEGKDILVTGGCGSIGSEIVRQLLEFNPKRIRVYDNDEAGHWRMSTNLKSDKIRHLIGDVRDRDRLHRAMHAVDIVFHAAALKHVPFCEYDPFEAVHTNVIGTQYVLEASINSKVKLFVGISTDKAVNPISTLGATKLLMEKVITNAPAGLHETVFCCVRFGNVLNSVGSVIPIFHKQIKDGGPVTITSDEMTRFFMSIEDAVRMVLKTAVEAKSGETHILKMDALKIRDLAEVMVEELASKYGHNPEDIKYEMLGVRPGEKMHEALMTADESIYMSETEDTLILCNSMLANYGRDRPKSPNGHKYIEYTSLNARMLSKEEVRKLLYDKKILE